MKDPFTGWLNACLDEREQDSTPLTVRFTNERHTTPEVLYILADVEAKRRQLARHRPMEQALPSGTILLVCMACLAEDEECGRPHKHASWPCPDVRDIAAPFKDQAGYRKEWQPCQGETTDENQ